MIQLSRLPAQPLGFSRSRSGLFAVVPLFVDDGADVAVVIFDGVGLVIVA